jgi:hypothetical protein
MRLPLSSSLPSIGSSDDGGLSKQLLLAGTNAEFNRISCCEFNNDSDSSSSPQTFDSRANKSIIFNPQVAVRFIRARSNTTHSGPSDMSNSLRSVDSLVVLDSTLNLKEPDIDSDDEEFDRFYRTMRPSVCLFTPSQRRNRRYSLDERDESPRMESRPRSVSCDELVFQSMKLGG